MSLEAFCSFDQIMVSPTSGSFSGPTDEALAELGVSRRVPVSLPSFHVLLETIRGNDFLALVPERLLHGKTAGLRVFELPMLVPDFDVIACWHRRLEADPAQRWIRDLLQSVSKKLAAVH